MHITMTNSKGTPEQLHEAEEFLSGFLPRFKQQPGVLAIYHFNRPDKGDELTIVVWENEDAVRAYRGSELIKEPIAFEKAHNMPTTREGYSLTFATSKEV